MPRSTPSCRSIRSSDFEPDHGAGEESAVVRRQHQGAGEDASGIRRAGERTSRANSTTARPAHRPRRICSSKCGARAPASRCSTSPIAAARPRRSRSRPARCSLCCSRRSASWPQSQAGTVRPLATGGLDRDPQLPDLPTASRGRLSRLRGGAMARPPHHRAGTPKDIVAKINAEVNKALRDPDLIAKLAQPGHHRGRRHAGRIPDADRDRNPQLEGEPRRTAPAD